MELLASQKYIISIKDLTQRIQKYSDGYKLTLKDKQFIVETYKSLYDDKGKLIQEEVIPAGIGKDSVEYFQEKFKQKYIQN